MPKHVSTKPSPLPATNKRNPGTARVDEPRSPVAAAGQDGRSSAMLAEIYGWFTEGFDTKDLQEAKVCWTNWRGTYEVL